jgi:hypothetical protein
MHSKWQIWDFFTPTNRSLLKNKEGILALNTFDPICLKLVKDFLTRDLSDKVLHFKMAPEVTKSWIEEEFQTLALFGSSDNFFIHQADDLFPDHLEQLLKNQITGRFVVLSFEHELALWKKFIKEGEISTLVIEAPRFWELNKLLDFVCHHLHLPLSYDAKNWILEALDNNLTTFYNSCSVLKLNYPDATEIGLKDVKELLTLERLDQFQLASLVARKKRKEFYQRLIPLEGDFEKMRGFFGFMQGHLIKMADPSYLSRKSRLTQYDKDLQSTSKIWKSEELMELIAKFNRWEILCKKKDPHLWHELRSEMLKSLTP